MAKARYSGKDVILTITKTSGSVTLSTNWKSISFEMSSTKEETTSADSEVVQRITKQFDASMTVRGIDSDDSNSLTLLKAGGLIGGTINTLTFTDDAGTPADKLPANFFTRFPVAKWRVDDVSIEYTDGAADYTMKLSPNNVDAANAL